MTKQQQLVIEQLRKNVITRLGCSKGEWEYKRFEVTENKYFVSVSIIVGMANDEGTYASLFARNDIHLFIGPKGGITYPVTKKLKDGRYKHIRKQFKNNYMQVHLEQNEWKEKSLRD